MNREQFFRQLLILGSSGFLTLTGFSSCKKKSTINRDKKIVVIGAGVAGLTAAKALHDQGFKVLVVEATGKIGGRLRTWRGSGIVFDEGASWIHGSGNNPITPFAQKAGITTFTTNEDSAKIYNDNGIAYSANVVDAAYSAYEDTLRKVMQNGSYQQSFSEVFQSLYPGKLNDKLWKFMLSAYLEFDVGADIAQIAASEFDNDKVFTGPELFAKNGYDLLAQFFASGLDVTLSTKATKIDYTSGKAVVSTNLGEIDSDYVVVAAPLGVLQQGQIDFLPKLPAKKQESVNRLKMGCVNKFLFQSSNVFWENGFQFIGCTPAEKGRFNQFLNHHAIGGTKSLITFAFGEFAQASETLPDAAIEQEVGNRLRMIYGNNIPSPQLLRRTKWASDEFTLGSYSFVAKGATKADISTLAEPLNRTLFFAGEHCSADYRGTVHGAYLSGLKAAEDIIKASSF